MLHVTFGILNSKHTQRKHWLTKGIMALHNSNTDCCSCLPAEFTDALCPTQWVVADGKLTLKGEIEAASKAEKLEWKPQEEQIDAFGNVVKIKAPKKKLSNKEKKQRAKVRKAQRERGEDVSDTDEDEL